jgi:hypothetical protein
MKPFKPSGEEPGRRAKASARMRILLQLNQDLYLKAFGGRERQTYNLSFL